MNKAVVAVIMAGGLGKRMNSNLPKVLHKISGIPMICHLLLKLKVLSNIVNLKNVLIVVGKYKDLIKEELDKYDELVNYEFVIQEEPLGTGHAVKCCIDKLSIYDNTDVLILSGDVPLLRPYTMNRLISMKSNTKIITTILSNPSGYGRIIKNNNIFEKIVEQKDCNKQELEIKEVNCGIYCIKSNYLCKHLPTLKNENSQNEYYLTDIIEIIKREENENIEILKILEENSYEILGVNTYEQLQDLEKIIIKNKIENKN